MPLTNCILLYNRIAGCHHTQEGGIVYIRADVGVVSVLKPLEHFGISMPRELS